MQEDLWKVSCSCSREHRFAYEPLISIVVPVYRTPEAFLREMVESVLGQTYASLELCLADGSGDDDHTERILKAYAEKDPRVRYEKLPGKSGDCRKYQCGS